MPKGIYKRKPLSKEHKEKLSRRLKGRPFSETHRANSIAALPRGEKHHAFSDAASLNSIHRWVRKRNPHKNYCTACGKKTNYLDLANISGIYDRNFCGYKYLCRKCHQLSDGRLKNLFYNKLKVTPNA